jgi:hypothetical protein
MVVVLKQMIRHGINMDTIKKYHIENHPFEQIDKTIEELEELIVELRYFRDGGFDLERLFDELFDAWIMMEQISDLFIVDDNTTKIWFMIIEAKIERELKRWDLKRCDLY